MENLISLLPSSSHIPLSSPSWLFVFFYVFTFFLHIIFMNFTLGGTVLLLVAKYISKNYGDEDYNLIAEKIGWFNTINISLTITTGVAPLLFIQTIYENFFYTSSIILSWKWLLVLVSIMFGYYFYYIYKFKPSYIAYSGGRGILFIVIALFLFGYVGFMLSTNTVLSTHPSFWEKIFLGESGIASLPTLLPRFLHFLLASVAFSGVGLLVFSYFLKVEETVKKKYVLLGKNAFIYPTLLQFIVGIWFLLSHPKSIYMLFMGGHLIGTLFVLLGILSAVILLVKIAKNSFTMIGVIGLSTLTMVSMVIVRRILENALFSQYFDYTLLKEDPQWDVFSLFVVLLVALLATLFIMFKRIYLDMSK